MRKHDMDGADPLHEELCAYLLDELEEGQRGQLEAELERSPDLVAERRRLTDTIALVRDSLGAQSERDVLPPEAIERLLEAASRRRSWSWSSPRVGLAAAAAALLMGWVGSQRSLESTIDAPQRTEMLSRLEESERAANADRAAEAPAESEASWDAHGETLLEAGPLDTTTAKPDPRTRALEGALEQRVQAELGGLGQLGGAPEQSDVQQQTDADVTLLADLDADSARPVFEAESQVEIEVGSDDFFLGHGENSNSALRDSIAAGQPDQSGSVHTISPSDSGGRVLRFLDPAEFEAVGGALDTGWIGVGGGGGEAPSASALFDGESEESVDGADLGRLLSEGLGAMFDSPSALEDNDVLLNEPVPVPPDLEQRQQRIQEQWSAGVRTLDELRLELGSWGEQFEGLALGTPVESAPASEPASDDVSMGYEAGESAERRREDAQPRGGGRPTDWVRAGAAEQALPEAGTTRSTPGSSVSGPSAPSPQGPSAPGPAGPSTPGPASPGLGAPGSPAPSAPAGAGRRGLPELSRPGGLESGGAGSGGASSGGASSGSELPGSGPPSVGRPTSGGGGGAVAPEAVPLLEALGYASDAPAENAPLYGANLDAITNELENLAEPEPEAETARGFRSRLALEAEPPARGRGSMRGSRLERIAEGRFFERELSSGGLEFRGLGSGAAGGEPSAGFFHDFGLQGADEDAGRALERIRFSNSIDVAFLEADSLIDEFLVDCRPRLGESPRDMFFRFWGDNAFEETRLDRVSTFSVDVDTASYALARNYIRRGLLPVPEAIRTEEFINYFDSGVSAPSEGVFALDLELAPSLFGAADSEAWMLRVVVRGKELEAIERDPLSIVLVVDVSGSMKQGGRLGLVQHAARLLASQLDQRDELALVAFSDTARVVLPATNGGQRGLIEVAVNQLEPEGSTNAASGYELAATMQAPHRTTRVMLLSDGVANTGVTDRAQMLEATREKRESGIYLNTLGVGMGNHNDHLLEQLADQGDGVCNYIDTAEEAQRVLVDDFMSALYPIARDVKVQVDFDPAQVSRYRLLGYENRAVADEDFRNAAVDAGEVHAGHQVTALYELERTSAGLDPQVPLATARLRYKAPYGEQGPGGDEEEVEQERSLWSREAAGSYEGTSAGFRRALLVAQFAEVLRQSKHSEGDSLDRLADESDRLAPELEDERFDEFRLLVRDSFGLVADRAEQTDALSETLDAVRYHYFLQAQIEELRRDQGQVLLEELDRRNADLEDELRLLLEQSLGLPERAPAPEDAQGEGARR